MLSPTFDKRPFQPSGTPFPTTAVRQSPQSGDRRTMRVQGLMPLPAGGKLYLLTYSSYSLFNTAPVEAEVTCFL